MDINTFAIIVVIFGAAMAVASLARLFRIARDGDGEMDYDRDLASLLTPYEY